MDQQITKIYQDKHCYALYNGKLVTNFTPAMLTPEYWQKQSAIIGSAQGRGTTYFIQHQQQQWVLRHYYRGGIIGKFNKDSYLFSHYKNTRAYQEFHLLQTMNQLNLPVPIPVACRVIKKGLFYRADLLTSRIEQANDLVDILSKKAISAEVWQQIGAVIARFHQHGIYHHDLNAHNILMDNEGKISVIDFDRGEQRKAATHWQQQNIERLLRSFRKELNKLPQFFWQEENWQQFIKGYQAN